jgi:hypothetical protein
MTLYSTITKLYNMSQAKSKIIQFRVTEQDFLTLYQLAEYLHSNGQAQSANLHLLSKEYTFAFANMSSYNTSESASRNCLRAGCLT